MTKHEPPHPSARASREEIARIEVGQTRVDARTARVLLAGFLLAIAIVPVVEIAGARARLSEEGRGAWSHLRDVGNAARAQMSGAVPADPGAGFWRRLVTANRGVLAGLTGFERALERESLLGQTLRRPTQVVMTRWLGTGNERVYDGRAGWLFYRPDVEYVTGTGFLDPAQMARRRLGLSEWEEPPQPDPRVAIRQLKRDLDALGIRLIVVPVPVKPGVHPEMLARRYAGGTGVLQNPSYGAWVDGLRQDGTLVFDPAEVLAAERLSAPQFLRTDTHWRPEAMELAVERLAVFMARHTALPPVDDPGYQIERIEVQGVGDTARMLDLPDDAVLFPPEAVWVRRVRLADGSVWRPSRAADVLLLGDSFANIYALESLGWGTAAGFAEQLSYVLRRPVDRLVQNDDGAFATRAMLARDPARLDGKRVVIYEFAVRELAFGDWKRLPLARPAVAQ